MMIIIICIVIGISFVTRKNVKMQGDYDVLTGQSTRFLPSEPQDDFDDDDGSDDDIQ